MVYIFLSAAEITSWSQNYALMGLIVFLLLLSILLVRTNGHPEELLETESTGNRHIRDIHRTWKRGKRGQSPLRSGKGL